MPEGQADPPSRSEHVPSYLYLLLADGWRVWIFSPPTWPKGNVQDEPLDGMISTIKRDPSRPRKLQRYASTSVLTVANFSWTIKLSFFAQPSLACLR